MKKIKLYFLPFLITILVAIIIICILIILLNRNAVLTKKDVNNNISISTNAYISNENVSIIEIDNNISNSDSSNNCSTQNVTIKIIQDTITSESLSILITDNNETPYSYSAEFSIQKKINGVWEDLDYISGELTWITIEYVLDENNQLSQKLDIEKYYGILTEGIYRIVKPVYDNGYINIYSDEFEI